MKKFQFKCILCMVGVLLLTCFSPVFLLAQDAAREPQVVASVTDQAVAEAVKRGADYLRVRQAEDGSFSSMMGSGITSITLIGLLQNGYTVEDPMVSKALKFLETKVHADGAIFDEKLGVGNYETSVAVVAFKYANKDGRYDKILKNAEKYLRKYQWDESEALDSSDIKYGGAGYGGGMSRPDLSNTGFLLDALVELGAGPDDEAVKKALVFVSRCQNLESQHNTFPWAAENPDGGFIYNPLDTEKVDREGRKIPLKSYGSMTYTGFKSLVYAGIKEDDIRFKSALAWLTKNYSVKENPGQDQAGLYYYYIVMAKTLKLLGKDTFKDDHGAEHNWRNEILAEILGAQQQDGSWVNTKSGRWMESNADLVTAYALMIIGNCKK
ncbi:MAG: terpene cyclase/mutase family protein [Planctomycetia bacterium]|nr:terpene cyclase/mutase family protein [Planctomycetia bacterium]